MDIVVIGAGIGGLAASLGLGRGGHRVVVVDRDPEPPSLSCDAFGRWERRSVRQFRQYHVFRARSRVELASAAPDVLDQVIDAGAHPLGGVRPSDAGADSAAGSGIAMRRPQLEWVLRQAMSSTPGVRVVAPSGVAAVRLDDRRRATGVVTTAGEVISADLVIDAGGRRSPVRGWALEAGFECPVPRRSPCGIAYYSRYYETVAGAPEPILASGIETTDDGFMAHALALGDGSTIGAIFVVPAGRPEFRSLGTPQGWDAAVEQVPRMAEVLDPDVCRPLTPPASMYGLENAIAPWRADGLHGPRRLAPIGDSWLVTNPNLAWGASVALAQGFALAASVAHHGSDVESAIGELRDRCTPEAEQRYAAACSEDRALRWRWRLSDAPRRREDLQREALLFGLQRLARHGDLEVRDRLVRRGELLELPDDLWADRALLDRARASLRAHPHDPDRRPHTLDEAGFLAAVSAATSSSEATRTMTD